MGGLGSGRYYCWSSKPTLEDYQALDVRWLNRKNMLAPCREFTCSWTRGYEKTASISIFVKDRHSIFLIYKSRNQEYKWTTHCYEVQLVWTQCNYGGTRPWFLCPSCRRRIAVLYGGAVFVCRHCCMRSYKSQSESATDRACRRADKIREKLQWELGILNGKQLKPKGMHWKTFNRLTARHNRFVAFAFDQLGWRFTQCGYTLKDLI